MPPDEIARLAEVAIRTLREHQEDVLVGLRHDHRERRQPNRDLIHGAATLLEVLHEDFVRTARAKGLSEFRVLTRHALRNATLPILTLLGLQLGTLLGGAVITEMVFAWPGIGQLTVEAIQRRDYPLLQACVLVISVAYYVTINTLTDVLYAWLDPRIRIHGNS